MTRVLAHGHYWEQTQACVWIGRWLFPGLTFGFTLLRPCLGRRPPGSPSAAGERRVGESLFIPFIGDSFLRSAMGYKEIESMQHAKTVESGRSMGVLAHGHHAHGHDSHGVPWATVGRKFFAMGLNFLAHSISNQGAIT